MSKRILEAQAIISAVDKTGGTFGKIAGDLARSQSRMEAVGRSMMFAGGALTAGVTLPLVAFGTASVKAAIEFEKNFAGVRKVLGDLPAERLKEIKRDIVDLSTEIPLAADEFARIYEGAGQANIAERELKDFSRLAAETAVAFDSSAEQIGGDLAKIKTAGNLTIEGLGDLTDVINELSNTSASTAPDLVSIVQQVGGIASVAGLAYGETAALGAAMVASGAGTDVAGTAIKNLSLNLTRGSAATKAQRTAWTALGLESVAVAKSMQKDAAGTIRTVFGQLAKLPEYKRASVAMQIFGKESLGAIGPLIDNLELLDGVLELVGDRSRWTGSRASEFSSQMDTADNQIQLLRNNVQALKITLGDEMLPIFKQGLTEAVAAVRWMNANLGPDMTGKVLAYGGALAAIGPALLAIGGGLKFFSQFVRLSTRLAALGTGAAGAATGGGSAAAAGAGVAGGAGLAAGLTAGVVAGGVVAGTVAAGRYDYSPESVENLKNMEATAKAQWAALTSGDFGYFTRASADAPRPAGPVLPKGWWLGGTDSFKPVSDAEALRAEMGLKDLEQVITRSQIRLDGMAGSSPLRGPLSLFERSRLSSAVSAQGAMYGPPMVPLPRARPGVEVPLPVPLPVEVMSGGQSAINLGLSDARRFGTVPLPPSMEGGMSVPRSQPTFEDMIRGGKLEAEVTGPVSAELKGRADVAVRVQVDGPGRIVGMSARDEGHVAVDVGVGMQDAIPGDGQL
jgi:TP901 family phage tail tape measure protein